MIRIVAVLVFLQFTVAQALEVIDIRCEDLVAPIGVDVQPPKLSWLTTDTKVRGQKETAWQVIVASSSENLAKGKGDLWDSGKVCSAKELRIPYRGKVLKSRQRCFWKVRVWDKQDRPSQWSKPSEWTMGILEPTDWNAQWIAHDLPHFSSAQWIWHSRDAASNNTMGSICHFRKSIDLPSQRSLVSAKVWISADDSFALRINGVSVMSGDNWQRPRNLDIRRYIKSGFNEFSIIARNQDANKSAAGLIAKFDFSFSDRAPIAVVTNEEWEASPDGQSWNRAVSLGEYGVAPWGILGQADCLHPWLRRNFSVKEKVKRALVFVNTPGLFELYVNGNKVGQDVLNPAYCDFTKRMFVVAYDVTSMLREGNNCIALWIAPGWYQPRYGNSYGASIVRAQLDMETAEGTRSIGTDSQWRSKASCISQIGNWGWADMGGELWNDGDFDPDWNLATHREDAWQNAREVSPPNVAHVWPGIPGNQALAPIKPVAITKRKGKWIVDFGNRLTGWVQLRMRGLEPKQEIILDYADLIEPQEMMHMPNPDGFQTFQQRDVFIAGNASERTFVSRFNQHAFQYLIIDGLEEKPDMNDIVAIPIMTALEPVGDFMCSNSLFNQIHEVSVRTLQSLIPNGVLGAGESREKEGYGDGANALTGFLYHFRSDSYFRKWLNDWLDSQRADGFIAHTAPRHVDHGGGPAWGGAASELVDRLLLYYDHQMVSASAYVSLKRYVDYVESHVKNDILRYYCPYGKNSMWYLGDWVAPGTSENDHGFPAETRDEQEFFNNCYRVLLWQRLANFARVNKDLTEEMRCQEHLQKIRPLIHREWFDESAQNYRVNRQAYLAFALLTRVMPEDQRALIFQRLEEAIAKKGGRLDTGMHGTAILMELLDEEGRHDLISQITAQTTFPSWGFLIEKRKVTTWPEIWSGWGSQVIGTIGNHGEWFLRGLAGIRPDEDAPGFRSMKIIPSPVKEVHWVRAHHDSPYGRIAVKWSRSRDNHFALDVEIPTNTTAEIHLPASDLSHVTESGERPSATRGIRFLRWEKGRAIFSVGSGSYQFRAKL